MTDTKILIVEDEVIVASNIEKRLVNAGYKVAGMASSAKRQLNWLHHLNPTLY